MTPDPAHGGTATATGVSFGGRHTPALVFVTANQNRRQGCRSFQCPRQAEVVVRFDHEIGDAVNPSPDWFWCLGHWPALRDMLHKRGHLIGYSAEALEMVGAIRQATGKLKAVVPKQPNGGHTGSGFETAGTTASSPQRTEEYADKERS